MRKMSDGLNRLIRDFDFRFDGTSLIQNKVPGFTSERVMGRFSSVYRAAEYLLPLVRSSEYTERFRRLTTVNR